MDDNLNGISNEFLEKTSPVGIDQGAGDFTICGWVQFNGNSGVQSPCSRWTNVGDQEQFAFSLKTGTPRFWQIAISQDGTPGAENRGVDDVTDTYIISGVPVLQRFLCAFYDGTADTLNLQVGNGPVGTTGSVTNVFAGSTESLKFGHTFNFTSQWALLGGVWGWGYWDRVLSQVERNFLYHKGFGRLFSDLQPSNGGFTATTFGFITQQLFLNRRR
jgi:hypothetical protein